MAPNLSQYWHSLWNKKKPKREREHSLKKQVIHKQMFEFSQNTTIHGIKYLGEKGRPNNERVWWILVFLLSLIGNFFLIRQIWIKWQAYPVIVTFSENITPVTDVPFPAVTICPYTKFSASKNNKYKSYLKGNGTPTAEEMKKVGDIAMICQSDKFKISKEFTDSTIYDSYKSEGISLDTALIICEWGGITYECSELFSELITEEGLCFSFNMLDHTELYVEPTNLTLPQHSRRAKGSWSLSENYDSRIDFQNKYPRAASDSGAAVGLNLILASKDDDFDYNCGGYIPGFKVYVHNPVELPLAGERFFSTPTNQEMLVTVEPEIMSTSPILDDYDAKDRQCFIKTEKSLKYFKEYTLRNCLFECFTDNLLSVCDCVMFYMPRPNWSTPICWVGKRDCANKFLMTYLFLEEFNGQNHGNVTKKNPKFIPCNCLPSCSYITYKTTISQSDYDGTQDGYNDEGVSFSKLRIFMKDKQFVTTRRNELYNLSDFLAAVGSLLNLFSGLSLISLIEVLFYVTLRFWNNAMEHRRTVNHGQDQSQTQSSSKSKTFTPMNAGCAEIDELQISNEENKEVHKTGTSEKSN